MAKKNKKRLRESAPKSSGSGPKVGVKKSDSKSKKSKPSKTPAPTPIPTVASDFDLLEASKSAAELAPKRPRRAVEVVAFEEPEVKLREERRGIHARADSAAKALEKKEEDYKERMLEKQRLALVRSAYQSVKALGASQFTGRERKEWEAKQIAAIGGKMVKKEKMPYKMFLGVQRKRNQREAKLAEEIRLSGVVTGKGTKSKAKERYRPRADDPNQRNKLRGGVLYVKPPSK